MADIGTEEWGVPEWGPSGPWSVLLKPGEVLGTDGLPVPNPWVIVPGASVWLPV